MAEGVWHGQGLAVVRGGALLGEEPSKAWLRVRGEGSLGRCSAHHGPIRGRGSRRGREHVGMGVLHKHFHFCFRNRIFFAVNPSWSCASLIHLVRVLLHTKLPRTPFAYPPFELFLSRLTRVSRNSTGIPKITFVETVNRKYWVFISRAPLFEKGFSNVGE